MVVADSVVHFMILKSLYNMEVSVRNGGKVRSGNTQQMVME